MFVVAMSLVNSILSISMSRKEWSSCHLGFVEDIVSTLQIIVRQNDMQLSLTSDKNSSVLYFNGINWICCWYILLYSLLNR